MHVLQKIKTGDLLRQIVLIIASCYLFFDKSKKDNFFRSCGIERMPAYSMISTELHQTHVQQVFVTRNSYLFGHFTAKKWSLIYTQNNFVACMHSSFVLVFTLCKIFMSAFILICVFFLNLFSLYSLVLDLASAQFRSCRSAASVVHFTDTLNTCTAWKYKFLIKMFALVFAEIRLWRVMNRSHATLVFLILALNFAIEQWLLNF